MNFNFLKGKRFWLFVLIFLITGIEGTKSMLPEPWAGYVVPVLSLLGVIKTFFPYEAGKSGEIGLGK